MRHLAVDRPVDPHGLALQTLLFCRRQGWPDAFLVDHQGLPTTGRCGVVPHPPFWVVRDQHAFHGVQVAPKAYQSLYVSQWGDDRVIISAAAEPAHPMLDLVAAQPWLLQPVEAQVTSEPV